MLFHVNRRVFLDGLLRAGTGASIETSIQLLKNKDLNGVEQKLVFLALGNAKQVSDEALKAAAVSILLAEHHMIHMFKFSPIYIVNRFLLFSFLVKTQLIFISSLLNILILANLKILLPYRNLDHSIIIISITPGYFFNFRAFWTCQIFLKKYSWALVHWLEHTAELTIVTARDHNHQELLHLVRN